MTSRTGEPSSRCLIRPTVGGARYVGDPVDVVTGALVDQEVDFRLPRAAVPLSWVRRFDSRQLTNDRGLGFGFRHELDRELRFDLDGMTYVDAAWEPTSFPHLAGGGQQITQAALRLERVDAKRYRVHEPDGRSFEFAFATPEAPGRLERIQERERTLSLFYERSGGRELLSAVGLGMLGRLSVRWANGRISSIALHETEPERETVLVTYRYDERGCLIDARNAYKHSLRYTYDSQSRLSQKNDRRGYSFLFSYDNEGRCVHSRGEDGAEGVTLQYSPLERTTVVTRHDGGTWRYQYNDAGIITHVLDPYGGMQAYVLDGRGRVVEEIDPLGNTSKIRYDARGVPVERVDVFGHVTPIPEHPAALHPLEHRVAQTPLAWEYGTLFEAPVRLPVTGDALWDVPFHARPLMQTAEPEWGGHARLERNLQGLPIRELREDGKARRWMFDENANVRKEVDFDGHTRAFEYASDNHLSCEVDALGHATRYEHSPSEQVTAITDAGGTRSEYVLDQKDRISEVRRHDKVRERYGYDLANNLVEKRNAAGEVLLALTVGVGNLKTARRLGSGEAQTFDYDERGRMIEARGAVGSCTFSYTNTGARVSDMRDGLGVQHAPDAVGTRATTLLGRFTTRYHQRSASEVTLVDPTGRSHTITRIGAGIYQRKLSNGVREVSQYDVNGRCLAKAVYHRFEDDQPWLRSFRYSAEGDLLEHQDSERGTTRFTYDAVHQLQSVIHPNRRVDAYEYDVAGNVVCMPSSHKSLRELGERDRFDIGAGNRLRAARGERIEYDDRDHICRRELGNRTTHYRRDALDQLLEIRAPGCLFEAKYDPFGRRTHKTVNGATSIYYWDTDRLAAEIFPNGSLRVYVYPAALALVPILFVDYASLEAAPESGAVYSVVSNHLGAVEQVLDKAGETVWRAQLDPYGLAHIESRESFHQPLRFPGHVFDSETGLHYNRFRYYDPKLARYLESDPIGISGGLNLYAYTRNPLREVDVRGLSAKCPNGKDCPKRRRRETETNPAQEGTLTSGASNAPGKPVGVSDHERKLAAAAGSRTEQVQARKRVADDFVRQHGQKWDPLKGQMRKHTDAERASELKGIDYSKPLRTRPPDGPDGLPPLSSPQYCIQAPGRRNGQYYSPSSTVQPTELGIGRYGSTPSGGAEKVRTPCAVSGDPPYMQSTAAPVKDTWSGTGLFAQQDTAGGGTQHYVPDNGNITPGNSQPL